MTAIEWKAAVMQDVEALLANEETKEKLLRSIRRLKAKVAKDRTPQEGHEPERVKPYTPEEIDRRIDESEADFKTGRVISSKQLFKEIREEYGWKSK